MNYTLGIGEYAIAQNEEDTLITYALGSCIAVLMYCPVKKIGAMAHIALPERLNSFSELHHKPAYFANIAVPMLIDQLRSNYRCNPEKLVVHLIGGATSRSEKDPFQVGQRNLEFIAQVLREHKISFTADNVGGHLSRTVTFSLASGELIIKTQQMTI